MPKNKKNYLSMSRQVEARKALKELKRLNRASRPLKESEDGVLMPTGWQNMNADQLRIDQKRRARENYYSRPKQKNNIVKAIFVFTMNELGVPPPTEEDFKVMEAIDYKAARKFRRMKPLDEVKTVPVEIVRDFSLSLNEQWQKERQLVKQYLIDQRIKLEEQVYEAQQKHQGQVDFKPTEPTTIDLNNLTTIEGA